MGRGREADDARAAIERARAEGESDEFVCPTVLRAHRTIEPGDEAIFFNFRNDRPRELSEALADGDAFVGFARAARRRASR